MGKQSARGTRLSRISGRTLLRGPGSALIAAFRYVAHCRSVLNRLGALAAARTGRAASIQSGPSGTCGRGQKTLASGRMPAVAVGPLYSRNQPPSKERDRFRRNGPCGQGAAGAAQREPRNHCCGLLGARLPPRRCFPAPPQAGNEVVFDRVRLPGRGADGPV